MTASDLVLHLSFKASRTAANGVAAVYAPLLQLANEPSTWRASLIPLYYALWKYTESGGVKYWYIKRWLTGQRQKPASGTSECRKPQFIMCLYFFTEDLIGRALRSVVEIQCLAQGPFSRTDARQHKGAQIIQLKGQSLAEPVHCCSIYCSQYSEHSPWILHEHVKILPWKRTSIFHTLHLFKDLVCCQNICDV